MFKRSVYTKYKFIYYSYSILTDLHFQGGMLFKPIFSNYPADQLAYDAKYINSTFLFGDDIIVAPVLDSSTTKQVYLPSSDQW